MGNIEVYKSEMPKGLRTFFETYETSMKELIKIIADKSKEQLPPFDKKG